MSSPGYQGGYKSNSTGKSFLCIHNEQFNSEIKTFLFTVRILRSLFTKQLQKKIAKLVLCKLHYKKVLNVQNRQICRDRKWIGARLMVRVRDWETWEWLLIGLGFFWEWWKSSAILDIGACMLSLQLCLILCDSMECSSPGSSVHGILQAGILGWVAMVFSRGSSWARNQTCVSYVSCMTGRFFITSTTSGDGHTTLEYTENHWIVYFGWIWPVNYISQKFLNKGEGDKVNFKILTRKSIYSLTM